MKLKNRYLSQDEEKVAEFVECLDLMSIQGKNLDYTREWIDKVNWGGLFIISDEAYNLVVSIEILLLSLKKAMYTVCIYRAHNTHGCNSQTTPSYLFSAASKTTIPICIDDINEKSADSWEELVIDAYNGTGRKGCIHIILLVGRYISLHSSGRRSANSC